MNNNVISSFQINHFELLSGLYVARQDIFNSTTITSFDLRIIRPNREPVMDTASLHALEHLGATFLRNHPVWQKRIVYFGPMGCRTGFYLVVEGSWVSSSLVPLITDMMNYIICYTGIVPGQDPAACGNYLDLDLAGAQRFALKYKTDFLDKPRLNQMRYPSH